MYDFVLRCAFEELDIRDMSMIETVLFSVGVSVTPSGCSTEYCHGLFFSQIIVCSRRLTPGMFQQSVRKYCLKFVRNEKNYPKLNVRK